MVFEEVGVFIEVDSFESELAKAFATVCVRGGLGGYASATEFGACAVLYLLALCYLKRKREYGSTHLVIHFGA